MGDKTVVKFIASMIVVMAISGSVAAHHTKVAVGWLIGFNERTGEILLNDGRTYRASSRIDFSLLNRGERFLVEFEQTRSFREIIAMIPVPVMDDPPLTIVNDEGGEQDTDWSLLPSGPVF